MKSLKRKISYVAGCIVTAASYFIVSYIVIFQTVAEESVLISAVLNTVLIFVVLALEKVENYSIPKVIAKIERRKPGSSSSKLVSLLTKGVSFKTSLYGFYIVLLACVALLAADPNFAPLRDMSEYFLSVQYGLLILIAADKFMDRVFKDLSKRND